MVVVSLGGDVVFVVMVVVYGWSCMFTTVDWLSRT